MSGHEQSVAADRERLGAQVAQEVWDVRGIHFEDVEQIKEACAAGWEPFSVGHDNRMWLKLKSWGPAPLSPQ